MMVKVGTRKCFKAGDSWQDKANKKRTILDTGRPKVRATQINTGGEMVEVKTYHAKGTTVQRVTRADAMRLRDAAEAMGIKLTMRVVSC